VEGKNTKKGKITKSAKERCAEEAIQGEEKLKNCIMIWGKQ